MLVEIRDIDTITPYEHNPRHNDAAVDAVARSVREFGFRQPVVVDEEGVIVVGHTRWKAAKKLGLTTVPVHVARGLTPAQLRAYRIADNQTATIATWNDDLLAAELTRLQGENYDLGLTGFDEADLLKYLQAEPAEGLTDAEDVPEVPGNPVLRATGATLPQHGDRPGLM